MIYGTMDGYHGDEDELKQYVDDLKNHRYNEDSEPDYFEFNYEYA